MISILPIHTSISVYLVLGPQAPACAESTPRGSSPCQECQWGVRLVCIHQCSNKFLQNGETGGWLVVSLKHEANVSPEQHVQSNLKRLGQNSTGSFPAADCSFRPPASEGEEERTRLSVSLQSWPPGVQQPENLNEIFRASVLSAVRWSRCTMQASMT